MYKELRFDVVVGAIRNTDKYDGEKEAIHNFNSSEHKNMVIEYGNVREARNAAVYLRKRVAEWKTPVRVSVYNQTNVLVSRV